jgi:LPXTG-site transpeptidase (sortase) family protein
MSNLSKTKKLLIVLGVCVVVFLILDFNYFWANLKFILHGQKQSYKSTVQVPAVQQKMQPNLLIVDSLGIKVPVVYVDQANETAFQAGLINGVVHYPGTANPGQLGNCYIFGHSSDYIWSKGHYKSIFAVLPSISKGAEIVISDSQGNKFTYIVTDSKRVAANDTSVLDQQNYQKKLLTLQTSYPVGTALARWVAIAEIK